MVFAKLDANIDFNSKIGFTYFTIFLYIYI